jgi:hypothetical protein
VSARGVARWSAALVVAGALAGCSQVASLVPVGGGPEATVRIATIDVLQRERVAILVAPVCTAHGDGITCTGTTVAKEPIATTSTGTDPYTMTVTVGGREIFSGTAVSVIDAAAQATS